MLNIRYANGTTEEHETVQGAAASALAVYPDAVIYDAGGFDRDPDDSIGYYDIRSGRVALIWATEEESVNDDGAHSIAEITEVQSNG
jgi:hypothetical protein